MTAFADGTFNTGKQDGPRRIFYPFGNDSIPDTTTTVYEHDIVIFPVASYAPGQATRNAGVPILESTETLDGSNTTAYLVAESPMSVSGGVGRYTRRYATVPGDHIIPGSRFFNRPSMTDIFSGSNWMYSFDDGVTSSKFTSRKTISAVTYYSATANTYTVTGHGFVAGQQFVMWSGDRVCDFGIVSIVTDVNNIVCLFANQTASPPATMNVSVNAATRYVNGPKLISSRTTKKFYLPGVTGGITTYADIPIQTNYADAQSWLGRIIAVPTGYAAIEVGEITQWEGAIFSQDVTEVQMTSALDTITP